ncbi:MAG: YggS family pyridoxal phosphate-dependent enzyme [Deltaproteobacteria bacterium]|jgi:pyridoxal phosphate enzyme (YggS family)|nr:YggS family pyridoxal phosphate-dependent enzyme [Deltaproteobacteria bacterium]MBW2505011.1 YggS family pyridoxal phosphate-dependent enzyme [Deltaproteobacteria bacterium]
MDIAAHIRQVKAKIADACARCNRPQEDVRLVAVSKRKSSALIDQAYAAGQTCFGESYVQEFQQKAKEVSAPVEWHFIGHLQSNKVKYLCNQVALIHSVDRWSLAEEIDRQWGKLGQVAPILIQVNLGAEASKSGTTMAGLKDLVERIAGLHHVEVRGLMTLPPWCEDPEEVRPYFRALRELAGEIARLNLPNVTMSELSMGMSHDFQVAIEEGATLIRVGTAIFGPR